MLDNVGVQQSDRPWLAATIATLGGGLVVVGAFLPWLTLFAGLHDFPGVAGLNGRILAVGGALAAVSGICLVLRPWPLLRWAVCALGGALALGAGWLLLQQRAMVAELVVEHPMTVAASGPGLLVALVGGVLLLVSPALQRQPHVALTIPWFRARP